MANFISVFFAINLLSHIVFAVAILPADLKNSIGKSYPGAIVHKPTTCELGAVKSFGFVVEIKSKTEQFPLVPAIATLNKSNWKLTELPRRFSYSRGSAANFLDGFWNSKNGVSNFEIRCTTPNIDNDISTSANGEFTKDFNSLKQQPKHLCFQADSVYNSWVCFSAAPISGQIVNSFNQMNAD